MPMKTDGPSEPAGQVPMGGRLSAARAMRGKAGNAAVASKAPPALSIVRRVGLVLRCETISVSSHPIRAERCFGGPTVETRGRLAPNCPDAPAIMDHRPPRIILVRTSRARY